MTACLRGPWPHEDIRRHRRRQRRVVRLPRRSGHGANRSQRRRQDDGLQPGLPAGSARLGRRSARRTRRCSISRASARGAGDRAERSRTCSSFDEMTALDNVLVGRHSRAAGPASSPRRSGCPGPDTRKIISGGGAGVSRESRHREPGEHARRGATVRSAPTTGHRAGASRRTAPAHAGRAGRRTQRRRERLALAC